MARVLPQEDWVRRLGALTVQPDSAADAPLGTTDRIVAAQTLVARLATAARGFIAAGACVHAADDQACDLAVELAALPVGTTPEPGRGDAEITYLRALRDAAGAVYYCRRVQHPGGRCWFDAEGEDHDDLCGQVLALTHRLAIS